MHEHIQIEYEARYPFIFGPVPPILRFRRFAFASGVKLIIKLSKFILKIPYRWLRFPLRGKFGIELNGTVRWVELCSPNWGMETVLTWPPGRVGRDIRALIDIFLPDNGVFVDIGANWGIFTWYAASRPGFTGHIHSFEPYPVNVADMESVLAQLDLGQSVTIYDKALSDRDGHAFMTVPDQNRTAMATVDEDTNGVKVALSKLDSLRLSRPDLIKLDAEGHEFEVLKGAEATIAEHRPVIVFESLMSPEEVEQSVAVVGFLEVLGYRIFVPDPTGSGLGGSARVTFTEIKAGARTDFPLVKDLCAIHRDRVDELLISAADR